MNNFGIEISSEVKTKNVKMMFWGATATRKTETILRNFPHVLIIDTEGKTDQCVDMPEIPPFLRVKTKDSRKIMEVLDAVTRGEIKFPDGSPVETFAIDSVSVLWGVHQEVAAVSAERRARKYNRSVETATMTQLDWVVAKRPIRRIYNRFNGSNLKFLLLIAREKDLYIEKGDDLLKSGVTADAMKGTDYEMNLVFHFGFENGKWYAEPTKGQGKLGKMFPIGKKLYEFPIKDLMEYASSLKPQHTEIKDDEEVAGDILQGEDEKGIVHTQSELIAFAKEYGVSPTELGDVLRKAGYSSFNPKKFEEMKGAILEHAAERGVSDA